ncbi:S-DNA-T family DNA segregation ATPase FtsK/SpoIIIE [Neobacillus niacini]|uniref:FtsK/SpoIIIE domain-containing protein n=1 Tax=Neobacillus driksii TaxID=3035913 RepID=UPI0027816313|nr:FtsK/SpoIIIE domain-containing protein [Neobacillus niacini]MDQ0975897.1 S-DNA-T family DNA segregation ATPase FtsK/SpoIIIE [Neobacillus niacini]
MIFEVVTTTIFGGIALKAYKLKSGAGNDSKKINKIFALSGLNVKDGSQTLTAQQLKKKNIEGGVEYRYRTPLGRSFEDYLSKKEAIQAGLNTRSVKFQMKDIKDYLKDLKFDKNLISNLKEIQIKKLTNNKEVEMFYDGVLKIRVYNEPMSPKIKWEKEFLKPNSWSVLIGLNREDKIYHDFDKRKSIIIAGVPGSGKSVVIKLIITSLILQNPDHVSFSLIDLKEGAAFTRYKNLKQVINFGKNEEEAIEILKDVQEKMNIDYKRIVDAGYEDVTEANRKQRHFLIIDEAADLADTPKAMELITDIVRKGRGSGYYVIYSTQYPSMQAVSSQIKRNIPSRLSYVLDSSTASVTVLDTKGAEDLPDIAGRGIYKDTKTKIIQTPFMSNGVIEELIKPFNVKKEALPNETPEQKARTNSFIVKETRLS